MSRVGSTPISFRQIRLWSQQNTCPLFARRAISCDRWVPENKKIARLLRWFLLPLATASTTVLGNQQPAKAAELKEISIRRRCLGILTVVGIQVIKIEIDAERILRERLNKLRSKCRPG